MLKINLIENDTIAILQPQDKLSVTDFINAARIIDPSILKHGKLKGLVLHLEEFPGWDSISALIQHLKFVHNHHKLISHVAVVTDSILGDFAEKIASHFIKAKIKNFDFDEINEAINWIKEDTYITHGLFFSCETTKNDIFIKFKAIGQLTHEDYEKITPIIDSTIINVANPKVNILIDIEKLEGWDLRAAWDDLKLGLKHRNEFNKIAIVGHKSWQELISKISNMFISSETKSFENIKDAINWLD